MTTYYGWSDASKKLTSLQKIEDAIAMFAYRYGVRPVEVLVGPDLGRDVGKIAGVNVVINADVPKHAIYIVQPEKKGERSTAKTQRTQRRKVSST